jgi:hypothetical protein
MPSPTAQRKHEIRRLALDILQRQTEVFSEEPRHFNELASGVFEVLSARELERKPRIAKLAQSAKLSDSDLVILIDVFWDLVGEGIISTAGRPSENEAGKLGFPYFRVISSERHGEKGKRAKIPRSRIFHRPGRSTK